ncbi:MAG TPA: sugar phosphate isomerase/epimerase [Candidatus Latescibacteria bacterium]|nr:sugar phosphate isomerase/epimerase [Candidatus Latescibacterota bacterium]
MTSSSRKRTAGKKALEVKEEYEGAGIEISCLAGFYVNHMDPEREEEYKDLVRKTILLAEKMGVEVVAGFAGRVPGLEPMECIPKFKEIWGEHAKFAQDHGAKIAFENCPMGRFHLPPGGINMMCLPDVWEAAFNEVPSDALGLEWDPSHLICMFIDPVANLRQFGSKELRRQGYDGGLDIEGWHDAVFRDHPGGPRWEREGLLVALKYLSQWVV